jgi:ACR3 family arsenite transporter
MSKERNSGIGFFEKYLTVWVILCMFAGVLIGKFLPGIPAFLGRFEYANVSIPMAILIWLMIYPMMLKVDFQSIRNVGKNPKGLFVTWITNWLIKFKDFRPSMERSAGRVISSNRYPSKVLME